MTPEIEALVDAAQRYATARRAADEAAMDLNVFTSYADERARQNVHAAACAASAAALHRLIRAALMLPPIEPKGPDFHG